MVGISDSAVSRPRLLPALVVAAIPGFCRDSETARWHRSSNDLGMIGSEGFCDRQDPLDAPRTTAIICTGSSIRPPSYYLSRHPRPSAPRVTTKIRVQYRPVERHPLRLLA